MTEVTAAVALMGIDDTPNAPLHGTTDVYLLNARQLGRPTVRLSARIRRSNPEATVIVWGIDDGVLPEEFFDVPAVRCEFTSDPEDVAQTISSLCRGKTLNAIRKTGGPVIGLKHGPEFDGLTTSERKVAVIATYGLVNAEIAALLCISPATVKNHLEDIYGRLGIRGKIELAPLYFSATVGSAVPAC
jgi:DNA-binding NarL/FixJ family response regulator